MLVALGRKLGARLLLLAVVSGCGDDDKGEDPVAQCNSLADAYCTNVVDCLVEGGTVPDEERDTQVADCKSAAKELIDCAHAIGVSESYDDCVNRLNHPDCDAINQSVADDDLELPDSCKGVIGVQE
jgi:hypothetical protein